MSFFVKYLALVAIIWLAVFSGCQVFSYNSSQFRSKVGEETYQILSNPKHVKIEGQRSLTESEIHKLQTYLLYDKGYIFDRTKKCLFIPEITFTFDNGDLVVVMVSTICKQIKIIHGEKTLILDTDSMAVAFHSYMTMELLK